MGRYLAKQVIVSKEASVGCRDPKLTCPGVLFTHPRLRVSTSVLWSSGSLSQGEVAVVKKCGCGPLCLRIGVADVG